MVNFSNYKINESKMFFLCMKESDYKIKNKHYLQLIENTFLEVIETRLGFLDAWLIDNKLPTNLSTPESWRKIHYFLLENAENNGILEDINFLSNEIIFKNDILYVQVPQKTLTPLWISVLIDLAIKMGQIHIERFPHWYWGVQDFMPKQSTSFASICIFDGQSDFQKENQDFSNFFKELCTYYIKNLARNKDSDTLTSSFLNLESKAERTHRFYLPLVKNQNVDNLNNFYPQIIAEYKKDKK